MKINSKLLIQPLITVAILLVGFFVYGKLVGPITISSSHDTNKRTFTVEGQGTVSVKPDKYYTDFTIQERAKTREEVQNLGNAKQEQALSALKKLGFADSDIKTTGYNINEDYSIGIQPSDRQPTPSGYITYISTQVTAKDVEMIEKAIDALTPLEINVNGVQSTIGDPEDYRGEARKKAIEQAKKKADSLASSAGFKLGKIASIAEGQTGDSIAGQPMPMLRSDKLEMSAPTQINPGENEVTAHITITYYIND